MLAMRDGGPRSTRLIMEVVRRFLPLVFLVSPVVVCDSLGFQ